MKQSIVYIIAAMTVIFLFTTLDAFAQERFKKIEMADGNYVLFKMTPQEIAAEDAQRTQQAEKQRKYEEQPAGWVTKIELPESGIYLAFAMTEQQILAAKNGRRTREVQSDKIMLAAENKVQVIEMADGQTVTFYTN